MKTGHGNGTGAGCQLRRALAATLVLGASVLIGACASTPRGAAPSPTVEPTAYTDDVFRLSSEADRAYRESRWIDAARQYRQLTDDVPSDAYAWFRLGNTYAQQGDYGRAIRAYESSLERDAGQAKPWFNLSTAYLLNARAAMMRAWGQLRPDDPARPMIERRLDALRELVHERIEDTPTRTLAR